jgi:hypothetical protein
MRPQLRYRAGRLVIAVAAAASFGLSLAACSSGAPGRQVASVADNSSTSSTPASSFSEAQSNQAMVAYTRCLRAHGINEPDPTAHPGHTWLSVKPPPDTPANQAALSACGHIIARFIVSKDSAGTHLSKWLPSLIRYAACMRSHDISMLDPGPQGQLDLGNVPGITSDFGRYSPQFRSADTACRHLLPRGVHDDGTGP